ncbi:MAG TPA: MBL fold metallo-hydrolase [Candidatus Limnocylindrales bacterium]
MPGRRTPATVALRFVGHATVHLDLAGLRVLTDPFLRPALGPLRRHGPLPDPATLGADVVLVSHAHPDHFDPASLASIPGRPVLVVPAGLGGAAAKAVAGPVRELAAGDEARIGPLRVVALPARHWPAPDRPRVREIGFLVEAPAASLYYPGDTAPLSAMRDLAGLVDVALLPVGSWGPHLGPGHLGPRSAARLAALLGPVAAVPVHWGTLYPRGLERLWGRPLDEPGPRFARALAATAPGVLVPVLRPGEEADVEVPPGGLGRRPGIRR